MRFSFFTACVKNGVLLTNPVANATKPRIGEMDIPPYLDNTTIPIFLNALNEINIDNSIRVSLILMLMLGLGSGDARALRWVDVDFNSNVVSIEKNAGDTFNGLALTDLKTKRSRRKLPQKDFRRASNCIRKILEQAWACMSQRNGRINGKICTQ